MRAWTAWAACTVLVLAAGLWCRLGLRRAASELETVQGRLREVEAMLASVPLSPDADRTESLSVLNARSIGASVQEAATLSGLPRGSIEEVSAIDYSAQGSGEVLTAYGIRMKGVRTEHLVRFIHALRTGMGLRMVRVEMMRGGGTAGEWDVFLSIVRVV